LPGKSLLRNYLFATKADSTSYKRDRQGQTTDNCTFSMEWEAPTYVTSYQSHITTTNTSKRIISSISHDREHAD